MLYYTKPNGALQGSHKILPVSSKFVLFRPQPWEANLLSIKNLRARFSPEKNRIFNFLTALWSLPYPNPFSSERLSLPDCPSELPSAAWPSAPRPRKMVPASDTW
jgi:hypothetical protein